MSERTVNVSIALTPAQVELLGKLALVYKEWWKDAQVGIQIHSSYHAVAKRTWQAALRVIGRRLP